MPQGAKRMVSPSPPGTRESTGTPPHTCYVSTGAGQSSGQAAARCSGSFLVVLQYQVNTAVQHPWRSRIPAAKCYPYGR